MVSRTHNNNDEECVSLLVAMYNADRFIERCVRSLLAQDYPFLEIVVVNDGSTDDSLTIIEKLLEEDNRIKVISIQNSGLSHARNVGIQNCSGDYFCFIDADDYVEKDYISSLLNGIKKSNCACCFSGVKTDKGDGKMRAIGYERDKTIVFDDDLKLFDNYIFSVNSGIYSAKKCKKILFDERVPAYGEDYLYRITLLKELRKASYINGSPYVYTNVNTQSITNDSRDGKFGIRAKCLIHSRLIVFEMFDNNRAVKTKVAKEALNILIVYYSNSRKWNVSFNKDDYVSCISMINKMKHYLTIKNRLLLWLQCHLPLFVYRLYFISIFIKRKNHYKQLFKQ